MIDSNVTANENNSNAGKGNSKEDIYLSNNIEETRWYCNVKVHEKQYCIWILKKHNALLVCWEKGRLYHIWSLIYGCITLTVAAPLFIASGF